MPHILVDADACPVKEEIYRVAGRLRLGVTLVANSRMRIPNAPWLTLKVVGSGLDVADDWIVEKAQAGAIVVSADILLAERCLGQGALVLGPSGKPFTEENIGQAVATRELMSELRAGGEITGGPAPLSKRDRSRFLHQLDAMVHRIRRRQTQDLA